MQLSEILNIVFGGTSVVAIIGFFVFWRQNKKLKQAEADKASSEAKQSESEADQADIETQMKKIELGNKYMEDTVKMVEMVKQSLDIGNENQKTMIQKLDVLSEQNDKQDALLTDIVTYLNGDFQDFIKRTHAV